MGQFDGKTVFITGGSSGIGAALGKEFARRGARVALAARRVEKLEEVLNEIRQSGGEGIAVECDVTKRESIDEATRQVLDEYERLDVVVANAGFGVSGPFLNLTTDDFRRQFETNVFGVIDTVYATLPHLIETKGRLAMVSSVFGRIGGPASSPYCASKFAVCGLAESLYYELADMDVAVTCINPGLVASNIRMTDNQGRFKEGRKDPAPAFFIMPTDKAARQMVSGIARRKFEVNITGHGKLGIFLSRHFPRSFRFLVRQASRGRVDKIQEAKRGGTTR